MPKAPIYLPDVEDCSQHGLDGEGALAISDFLRGYAEGLDTSNVNLLQEYKKVARHVFMMQSLHNQMDLASFIKEIRELSHRSNPSAIRASCGVAYKVAYMVKVMTMADLLRRDSDIGNALVQAARMTVPPVLFDSLVSMVKEAAEVMPNKGKISRWRVLIDGSYMLMMRRLNTTSGGERRFIRHVMADSSMQRGRDFLHIVVLEIECAKVGEMFEAACELAEMWQSNNQRVL